MPDPDPTFIRERLADVCTVAVTPMSANGSIDYASAERLADHIGRSGVGTLTVGGSVGEILALTRSERHSVLRIFLSSVAIHRLPVIAAVAGDVASATEDAIDAVTAGAAAIMIHQPSNPFASPEGWLDYHERIASAVDPLPIVLYRRDPTIDESALMRLADSCPNVMAIKDAVSDPVGLARMTSAFGQRVVWLCGLAETWAPFAWAAGARGFTSGLANVDAALPIQLLECLRRGEREATLGIWASIAPFELLRTRRGAVANVGVVKAALMERGLVASDGVRPPVAGLTDGDRQSLSTILDTCCPTGAKG